MMDAPRRFDFVIIGGFLCWILFSALISTAVVLPDGSTTATLAVGLAIFVIVPLVARLADLPFRTGTRSRWYRSSSVLSLPAAVGAFFSLLLEPSGLAAFLAVPWFIVTGLLAVFGLQRSVPNTLRPAELAVGIALLYLPVAGLALVAHRADVTFGFGATTLLLTVVHFHYAGCALPAFVGLLGREFGESQSYKLLLAPVLVGPGIIGLGIAFSQVVELMAATMFAIVVAAIAVYTLILISPKTDRISHVLLGIAAIAVTSSMIIVVAYLMTRLTPMTLVTFEQMLVGHGWLNAVGFAFLGLLGWRLLNTSPRAPPLGIPISRLTARGRVGAEYLKHYDLSDDGNARGMVEGFTAFDGPACDSGCIDPDIKRFYERTTSYDLRITPTWEPGFRLGARLYAHIGRRVEQMNFPVTQRDPNLLSSRIVSIKDRADGRENVRAWVRTYTETGSAIYVALYATHRLNDQPYMNIAFPLPYSNLTSVLTVESLNVANPDGIVLSTNGEGDAGIYMRTPIGPLRLPMNETIRVWSAGMDAVLPEDVTMDGSTLFARHDMFIFGRRFLRLDYRITETSESIELADSAG